MKKKKHLLSRMWKWTMRFAAIAVVIFTMGAGGAYYAYGKDLPSDDAIINWQSKEATRIYDRNGTLLYQIYGDQKRIVVPSEAINPYLKQATIAIEDERFYHHYGIDPHGIARAFVENVKAGTSVEGGSTITQQLAKNTFLTSQRTIDRKVREAFLALKLEQHYDKEKILTLYLNQIGYGSNAYGAEAAANMYFGKSAKDLNLPEAATLAALTKSPSQLSPYGPNKDDLIARRNIVLDRMQEQGYVTAPEAEGAKNAPLSAIPREEKILAPHFVMYVKQLLIEKYGQEVVESGGLQVTTSLDLSKQQMAEDVAKQSEAHLARSGASNVSMVAINPKNGEILAMVGSRDYFDQARDGNVNVATSTRPPGSAFKPIVYAAAFDKGPWAPGSTLFDLETNFGDEKFPYMPKNYDGKYHGPVSIREALANSYNVPAVKAMALVGKNETLAVAKNLGITTLNDPDKYGLSLVLGGGDVKLVELAGAYGSLANNGDFYQPTAILSVTQKDKTLFEHTPQPKRVFRPQAAFEVTSILADNQARSRIFGPRSALVIDGRNVAAKTGTTQDYRDAWTVGYTPSFVVGVWVGNNDYSPMKQGSAGAMAAAPIWNSLFSKLLEGTPNESFAAPEGLEVMTVDAITGKQPSPGTRETRQDIFAEWQKPSSVELASYRVFDCSGGMKEQKSYSLVRSEKPDDPSWEKPVIAWARSHGYPTSKQGDIHETCSTPSPEVVQQPTDTPIGVGGSEEVPITPIQAEIEPPPTPVPTPAPVIVTPQPEPEEDPALEPTPVERRRPRPTPDSDSEE